MNKKNCWKKTTTFKILHIDIYRSAWNIAKTVRKRKIKKESGILKSKNLWTKSYLKFALRKNVKLMRMQGNIKINKNFCCINIWNYLANEVKYSYSYHAYVVTYSYIYHVYEVTISYSYCGYEATYSYSYFAYETTYSDSCLWGNILLFIKCLQGNLFLSISCLGGYSYILLSIPCVQGNIILLISCDWPNILLFIPPLKVLFI